jgi:hypothetical protein
MIRKHLLQNFSGSETDFEKAAFIHGDIYRWQVISWSGNKYPFPTTLDSNDVPEETIEKG